MSRQVHYKVPFANIDNSAIYTVYICEEGYTGDVVTLTGSSVPFETSEEGTDDVSATVHYSTGYLRIVTDDDSLLSSLSKQSPSAYRVYLYNETKKKTMWNGYLQQQAFSQPAFNGMSEIEIPVISQLGYWMTCNLSEVAEGYMSIAALFQKVSSDPDTDESILQELYLPDDEFAYSSGTETLYSYSSDSDVTRTVPHCMQIRFNIDLFKKELEVDDYSQNNHKGPFEDGTYEDVFKDLCGILAWAIYENGNDIIIKSLLQPTLTSWRKYLIENILQEIEDDSVEAETIDSVTSLGWNGNDHSESRIAPKKHLTISLNTDDVDVTLFSTSQIDQICAGWPVEHEYNALTDAAHYSLYTPYLGGSVEFEYYQYDNSADSPKSTGTTSRSKSIYAQAASALDHSKYGGGEFLALLHNVSAEVAGQTDNDEFDGTEVIENSLFLWCLDADIAEAVRFKSLHYYHLGTPNYSTSEKYTIWNKTSHGFAACLTFKGNIKVFGTNGHYYEDLTQLDDATRAIYVRVRFQTVDGTIYHVRSTGLVNYDGQRYTDTLVKIPVWKGSLKADYKDTAGDFILPIKCETEMYGRFLVDIFTPDPDEWEWVGLRIENFSVSYGQNDDTNIPYSDIVAPPCNAIINSNGDGDWAVDTKFSRPNRQGTLYSEIDKKPLMGVGAHPSWGTWGYYGIDIILNRLRLQLMPLIRHPLLILNIDVTDNVIPTQHVVVDGNSYSVLGRSINWRDNNHNLTLYRYGED